MNKQFNNLIIKDIFRDENNKPVAYCICKCKKTKIISLYNVIKGNSKTCGCGEIASRYNRKHSKDNIIGQKYGKLTVIKDSGKRAKNSSVLWECLCDCGNIAYVNSSNLKNNHTTSCGCVKREFIEMSKLDIIGRQYGYLTVLEEVKDNSYKRRKVRCICSCGKEIICTVLSLTSGHTMSCGCMRKSKGEMYIEELLKKYKICYISQKRFEKCKNKRELPFDFYLPKHNICIEYQGQQHYHPIEYWGGKEKFEIYKNNDNIKKIFCNNNDIHLICLPYTLSNEEIKEKILNILEPVTSKPYI